MSQTYQGPANNVSLKTIAQFNTGATTNIQLNAIRSAQGGKYWNPGDTQVSGQARNMDRFRSKNYYYLSQDNTTGKDVQIAGQAYVWNSSLIYSGGSSRAALNLQNSTASSTVYFKNSAWIQASGGNGGQGGGLYVQQGGNAGQTGYFGIVGTNISAINMYNNSWILGGAGGGGPGRGDYYYGGGGGGGGAPGGLGGSGGLGYYANGGAGQNAAQGAFQPSNSGGGGGGGIGWSGSGGGGGAYSYTQVQGGYWGYSWYSQGYNSIGPGGAGSASNIPTTYYQDYVHN
jgi:hypothetical protein